MRGVALGLSLLFVAAANPVAAQLRFNDVTAFAGLDVLHYDQVPAGVPVAIMAGAAAVADVNGDGHLDLYMTRIDGSDRLFINDGFGRFVDGTAAAGLALFSMHSSGAGFADIDNDGDPDLYVTTVGAGAAPHDRNYLFINDGSGHFTEEAASRGAAVQRATPRSLYSVSFGDYDRDGWIDMHMTEWSATGDSNGRLLRNRGADAPGHFEDKTIFAGVAAEAVRGFASSFSDLDGDGWVDIALTADFGTSRLFWNDGDGTFTDGTVAASVGTDENGMGSTIADFDGDGDLDWFVTSIFDELPDGTYNKSGNRFYRNDGGRQFTDRTDALGVRNGEWGWGTAMFDGDNDGDLDLVMTNGYQESDDSFNHDRMRFWVRNGETELMPEVGEVCGLTDEGQGRGLVVFDYDADGDLDIFIVRNGNTPLLYRNDTAGTNDWLRVAAIGDLSNRDGYGAIVTLDVDGVQPLQRRVIGSVTHFLGHSDPAAFFGLGAASVADVARVSVHWPSGKVQFFDDVPRNGTFVVDESTCVDADGDDRCTSADCDDANPAVYIDAVEINDGLDNQCAGDLGFGLTDELAAEVAFAPEATDTLTWAPQAGATDYQVARSAAVDFASCTILATTGDPQVVDGTLPAPGGLLAYLVRASAPNAGSWGAGSGGSPRALACAGG